METSNYCDVAGAGEADLQLYKPPPPYPGAAGGGGGLAAEGNGGGPALPLLANFSSSTPDLASQVDSASSR